MNAAPGEHPDVDRLMGGPHGPTTVRTRPPRRNALPTTHLLDPAADRTVCGTDPPRDARWHDWHGDALSAAAATNCSRCTRTHLLSDLAAGILEVAGDAVATAGTGAIAATPDGVDDWLRLARTGGLHRVPRVGAAVCRIALAAEAEGAFPPSRAWLHADPADKSLLDPAEADRVADLEVAAALLRRARAPHRPVGHAPGTA